MNVKPLVLLVLFVVPACSATGSGTNPATTAISADTVTRAPADDIEPYTPGDAQPEVAVFAARPLAADEVAANARFAAQLRDPRRAARMHYINAGTHAVGELRHVENTVGAGNGEAVGMWVAGDFVAQGSIVNMGVQPNYIVGNGGNFYHTHQFVPNECVEYGINYSSYAPYLFAYNWCSGGNTPQGWLVKGLMSQPAGVLNTWNANGNGWLLAWDSKMGTYKISIEEVLEADGWHILGYNWSKTAYVDIMANYGVTGTSQSGGGWAVMEEHNAPRASCDFDPTFPTGTHLLYDTKKRVLVNGSWKTLDAVPSAGITANLQMDCADISGTIGPGDISPYFSGEYFAAPGTGEFGPQYAGSFWLTQR